MFDWVFLQQQLEILGFWNITWVELLEKYSFPFYVSLLSFSYLVFTSTLVYVVNSFNYLFENLVHARGRKATAFINQKIKKNILQKFFLFFLTYSVL